ncbi:hypothetical protein TCAP_07025 [Tolypocladium capitatum]|uniref:Uncharacterized protein n=1 Tax=Tolypocladium capitatum TaxID=45235 RepID=A0A2K3Q601_9HYPO|nr:hypothetical protein TCAP_07025 [Tolypocladium capitatum]
MVPIQHHVAAGADRRTPTVNANRQRQPPAPTAPSVQTWRIAQTPKQGRGLGLSKAQVRRFMSKHTPDRPAFSFTSTAGVGVGRLVHRPNLAESTQDSSHAPPMDCAAQTTAARTTSACGPLFGGGRRWTADSGQWPPPEGSSCPTAEICSPPLPLALLPLLSSPLGHKPRAAPAVSSIPRSPRIRSRPETGPDRLLLSDVAPVLL